MTRRVRYAAPSQRVPRCRRDALRGCGPLSNVALHDNGVTTAINRRIRAKSDADGEDELTLHLRTELLLSQLALPDVRTRGVDEAIINLRRVALLVSSSDALHCAGAYLLGI
jgi:hypothetical protein